MAQIHKKTMTKPTVAEGENVLDIQSLARRAQDFGAKVDWWNDKIIWVLVAAALVALLTVLATYMAFRRAKQFADAQAALDTAKEKILSDELNARSLELEQVRHDTAKAIERTAKLDIELAQAKTRQAQAEIALAGAQKELQPRKLGFPDFFQEMKKSPPGKLVLVFQTGTMETKMYALDIWNQLTLAGWTVGRPTGEGDFFGDKGGMIAELIFVLRDIDDVPPPIKALREKLVAHGQKKIGFFRDNSLPDDTPRLWVGPRITWGGLQPAQ
jgi:hypothetical protein